MPEKTLVAQRGPYRIEVRAGKSYLWGACGRSSRQPFGDGNHGGF